AGGPFTVIAEGMPLPAFDVHCPLMTLPAALATTLDTIPAVVPYLDADPIAVERWKNRLGETPGLKVGLVWAGNPAHKNDRQRSIRFDRLAALFDLPGVRWFSLQVGERVRDLVALGPGQVTDLSSALSDFAEAAAAITNLDLVISVDTAAAHL